ncbi:NAD(+) diphosphatase [Thaumasiovibrio subtropicus]|uniref:NAD(+) diphosphatase n=1 Tax=Thaumasiovibrio subtropicus TaxID=1891207 RepID=UPI000B35CE46|nr:NAD(+) diphosphatase [Thaumasiovibrio subtropicus]
MSQFEQKQTNAYWCIVHDRNIALIDNQLPYASAKSLGFAEENAVSVGVFEGDPVYWIESDRLPEHAHFQPLRGLLAEDAALFQLAGRAMQLSHMKSTQKFCGLCGGRTRFRQDLVAMACDSCGQWHYPRVSPCIIVAVRRGGEILLAQHPRHRNGMYTILAGFVEAGETLEQCVAREVKEETGIEVKNIRYVASQPWAFPSNLMMGFIADYAGGDLAPDYSELSDARWCQEDDLPPLAPVGTIARRLIEDTLAAIRQDRI